MKRNDEVRDIIDIIKPKWNKGRQNTSFAMSLSCKNISQKCDPTVVVELQEQGSNIWIPLGQTEVVPNETNAEFMKTFTVHFFFEKQQKVRFKLYNKTPTFPNLLGEAGCTLGQIVKRNWRKYRLEILKDLAIVAELNVSPEEINPTNEVVHMTWRANITEKESSKLNMRLHVLRCNEDSSYKKCFMTDPVKNSLTPSWNPIEIKVQELCNGDEERPIKFELIDCNKGRGEPLIGAFTTKLGILRKDEGKEKTFKCFKSQKLNGKNVFKETGSLTLSSFRIERELDAMDYIRGGTDLSFVIGIDFTCSNEDPMSPESLHCQNGNKKTNQYALAIQAVGEILEVYSSDKMFPAYGFGAKIPPRGKISHLFPLNFNRAKPECHKIEGVLKAYSECLDEIEFAGPTILSPIVETVEDMASKIKDASKYFVLLIITDGVLTDMDATKAAIIRAVQFPVSIIIVGVGKANFDAMEELDGDEERLCYQGKKAERDIVQFVPFRKYLSKDRSEIQNKADFAAHVLEEIPEQLCGYMKQQNLPPIHQQP